MELKDTNYDAFLRVLEYLYTGQCPCLSLDETIVVLALANFFCLPRLVALCEQIVVKELQVAMATDEMTVAEDVIGKGNVQNVYICHNFQQCHTQEECTLKSG